MTNSTEEALARELVGQRDRGRCFRCQASGRMDYSHRVTRGVAEHRWSPANALLACRSCHQWMHDHPALARASGWHVSQFGTPDMVPARRYDGWALLRTDGAIVALYQCEVDASGDSPELTGAAFKRLRLEPVTG